MLPTRSLSMRQTDIFCVPRVSTMRSATGASSSAYSRSRSYLNYRITFFVILDNYITHIILIKQVKILLCKEYPKLAENSPKKHQSFIDYSQEFFLYSFPFFTSSWSTWPHPCPAWGGPYRRRSAPSPSQQYGSLSSQR